MKNNILIGILSLTLAAGSFTACDDDDVTVVTAPILSEVTTGDASVTATTASITGSVKGLGQSDADSYKVGVIYSTQQNPTAGGTTVAGTLADDGTVVTNLTGLNEGVTYYYATFVTLQNKVSKYGEVKSFITTDADIATAAAADVKATTANLSGTLSGVQDKVQAGTIEYGVAIAPAGADISAGRKIPASTEGNTFTVAAASLVPNTAYDFAAYMTLNGEYVYGNTQTLTTAYGSRADMESDDYVDMGTSVEWCRYNVGAATEDETGALFGYGDLHGISTSTAPGDYATGDISGTANDVAVSSGMGFMPSEADWAELFKVCDVASGDGRLTLTSRTTGNSIVLPQGGLRTGAETTGGAACYWSGTADATNADYAVLYKDGARTVAVRSTGASVRPVRKPFVKELAVSAGNIAVGDLENNGRIRLEFYNEFGSTHDAPAVDLSKLGFDKQMIVEFTIAGLNGNLVDGAKGSYRAGLEFAAGGWYPSYWSSFDGNAQDCIVNGDGTYRVAFNTPSRSEGAVVFCVDIDGLGNDCADKSLVKVTDARIILDPAKPCYNEVDLSGASIWCGNKEDNGTDVRIEFYNEYGPSNVSGDPFAGITFGRGTTVANVTITGIDGNLKSGVESSFTGAMSFADADWWPSWWGGGATNVNVTGDGTYNFPAYLEGDGSGSVVWCIDINGLWSGLADTSKLQVKVNNVITPAVFE